VAAHKTIVKSADPKRKFLHGDLKASAKFMKIGLREGADIPVNVEA
jgi:hypothetical protein